jgi:hypothetical protein
MTVVTGDAQSDTIGALLATPIRVQAVRVDPVTLATTPAANQIVNFVAVETGCGRAFAGSAITDANGNATDRWELGTKTGICHMEVRTVDQVTGQPVVYATASATIKAGAVTNWSLFGERVLFLSSRVSIGELIWAPTDRMGNTVENPKLILEAPPEWGSTPDSLFAPATETTGQLVIRAAQRTDTVEVASVRDLRLHQWTSSLTCVPWGAVGNKVVDSVVVPVLTIDRVRYGRAHIGADPIAANPSELTNFLWSGVATYYLPNNTTETRQLTNIEQRFDQDSPFTISLLPDGPALTQSSGDPIAYSGERGPWCNNVGWGEPLDAQRSSRTMTLTATP